MDNNQKFQRVDTAKGSLFINQSKQPGTAQPDFTGKVTFEDGTEHRVSGWNSIGQQSGTPYISFKLWQKADTPSQGSQPTAQGDSIFPTPATDEPNPAFGKQVQQQPSQQQMMRQGQDEIPF